MLGIQYYVMYALVLEVNGFYTIFAENITTVANGKITESPTQAESSNILDTTANYDDIQTTSTLLSKRLRTVVDANDSSTVVQNPSSTIPSDFDQCYQYGTCNFVSTLEYQYCYCDSLCTTFDDCCHDALNDDPSLFERGTIKCIGNSNVAKYHGTFIINKCPNSYKNTEIDQKCRTTDIREVGPWVLDKDGFVYQNKYCVECHQKELVGVFSVKVSNIPTKELTERSQPVQDMLDYFLSRDLSIFLLDTMKIEQIPPDGYNPRRCLKLESPMNNNEKCNDYAINPVLISYFTFQGIVNELYRNHFCVEKGIGEVKCLSNITGVVDYFLSAFPLSVLFTFGTSEEDCQKVSGFCLGEEVYKNYKFTVYFDVESTVYLPYQQLQQTILAAAWSYAKLVNILSIALKLTETNYMFKSVAKVDFKVDQFLAKKEVLNFEKQLRTTQWTVHHNLPEGESATVNIIEHKNKIQEEFRFDIYYRSNIGDTEIAGYRDLTAVMDDNNVTQNVGIYNVNFCRKFDIICDVNQYRFVISGLECIGKFSPKSSQTIKIIITYSGLGLSVVSLVGVIIVYRKTGLYKSVSGSNTVNLLLSLLLADLLFMVGIGANEVQVVCYIVGVILHYLFLCMFAFASIALVYMTHRLLQMCRNMTHSKGSIANTKLKLTILGLSVPLVFVAPSVVFDQTEVFDFRLNYDGNICFPTGNPGNLIFISCPIGLGVMTNVICLMIIGYFIAKTTHHTNHVRKSTTYQYIPVFFRVSAVTGIFWISGLLGSLVPTELTEYVFLCSCSFQGVFVSFAFLSTRQIVSYFRTGFSAVNT